MIAGSRRAIPMALYLRRLVWLSILPLLLLAVVLAADTLRRLRAADDRAGVLLAAQLARQVDDLVQQRKLALEVLAASPLLDERRLADFHRRAQVFPRQFGSDLMLADAQGHMLLHTGVSFGQPLPALPRPSGRAAAPIALASGKAAVGDVFMGPIAKRPLVAIAVPVLRDGKAEQVLLTTIDTRAFQEQVQRAGVPEGWQAALLDSRHELIAGAFGAGSSAAQADGAGAGVAPGGCNAPWAVVVGE